jgi:hypothetical protein
MSVISFAPLVTGRTDPGVTVEFAIAVGDQHFTPD